MRFMPSGNAPSIVAVRSSLADWAGMLASIACAIHCAAMPILLTYLPALGLSWIAEEGFHQWMTLICFLLAITAFIPGWRKHKSFMPLVIGGVGLTFLTVSAFAIGDSCCPTISTDEQTVAAGSTDEQIAVAEDGCTDESCVFCHAESTSESPEKNTSFASFALGLLTPLGGLLLVTGHVVNHRKHCQCRGQHCCLDDNTPVDLSTGNSSDG